MKAVVEAGQSARQTLVLFSPLPPVENGIADYCAELLPELALGYELVLIVDNHVPTPVALAKRWTVLHLAEFLHREQEFKDAAYLYHIGNNPDHVYLVPVLLRHPGILVLHDISLHYLVDQMTLRWGAVDDYCELLEREFGNPGRVLAEQFRSFRLRERAMFYELPMIRLIASRSRAIIVHSWFGKTKVLAQEPDVPVEIIPHHLAQSAVDSARTIDKNGAREFLGVEPDELLLVSLGFITRAKQIDTVLEVLARCRDRLPKFRYILAGQDQPEHYDVRAMIKKFGLDDVVEVTGYLEEDDFYVYSIAADLVLNLRYPTGGETSGTLIRALGVGACVMVVDIGPFAEFPDDACVKIPWTETFDVAFTSALLDLVANPGKRHTTGAVAKRHIQTWNSLSASGASYRRIINQYADRPVLPWRADQTLEFPAPAVREQILSGIERSSAKGMPLWFRAMQFPLALPESNLNVLVIGQASARDLLCAHLGYEPGGVRVIPAEFAAAELPSLPRRSVARAIFTPIDCPSGSELHELLTAVNRILEIDGVLLIVASHAWPAAGSKLRKSVSTKLQKTGFRLIRYMASPQDLSFAIDVASPQDGEPAATYYFPCWLATKVSEFIEPATPAEAMA